MALEFTLIPIAYLGTAVVLTLIAYVIGTRERNELSGFINPFVTFLKWLLISIALLMVILNLASTKHIVDYQFNYSNVTLTTILSGSVGTAFSVNVYSHMFIIVILFVMFVLTLFEYARQFVKRP